VLLGGVVQALGSGGGKFVSAGGAHASLQEDHFGDGEVTALQQSSQAEIIGVSLV